MKSLVIILSLCMISTAASAQDIAPPKGLADDLGLGMISSIIGTVTFQSPDVVLKSKICALNSKEKSNFTSTATNEELFEEIQYFVQVQETYVKPLMRDQASSGGEVCGERCQRGKDLQNCLGEMAERRKAVIDRSGRFGFSCFKKFEDNFVYLNSNLLNSSLEPAENGFDNKLEKIAKAKRFECGVKISDTDKTNCLRKIATHENQLYASCPQDATAAARSRPTRGSGSAAGSR